MKHLARHALRVTFGTLMLAVSATPGFSEPPTKQPILATPAISLYGYLRLDMSYDTDRMYPGNYAFYPKNANPNDDQFTMTANQTRLGLNFNGPDWDGHKLGGKVEMDFYGGVARTDTTNGSVFSFENKSLPMLRLAYLEAMWVEADFSVLAGQNWDLVSPMFPDTINYTASAAAGEYGYRRPQVRFTKGVAIDEKTKVTFKAALTRTIGDLAVGSVDSGLDSGVPSAQGSLDCSCLILTSKPTVICVYGHFGKEEFDLGTNTEQHRTLDTWSLGLDAMIPVMNDLGVKGSVWRGSNLDTFLAGVLKGTNAAQTEGLNTQGAWISVSLGPWSSMKFNLGASAETPQQDQLPAGGIFQNSAVFLNGWYMFSPAFQVGAELSHWRTLYKEQTNGEAARAQVAMVYFL